MSATSIPTWNSWNTLPAPVRTGIAGISCGWPYYTGLRKSELLRVNAGPGRHIVDGRIVLDSNTKTGRPGVVPIARQVLSIARRMPLAVTESALRTSSEAARAAVGRKDLHFHDMRHGFASLLAEAGADFLDIMKLMRHTSPASTKRYTHPLDARLRKIIGRLPVQKRSTQSGWEDAKSPESDVTHCFYVVPEAGLEPARPCGRGILSALKLQPCSGWVS